MADNREIVHLAFGPSRAKSIQRGQQMQGCSERVIGLPGALNVGPIDPPDPEIRQHWIRTVLQCDPDDDRRESELPWTEATSASVSPVFWVCMSDAGEQACFLEFAFRMAGRPFDIVDATGLDFVTQDGVRAPWSLGLMRPEDIVASRLLGTRRAITRAESDTAAAAWSRLRRENAPLRVVRDGRLVSAPLTYFDAVLLTQATPEWEVAASLIGRTLNHLASKVEPRGQSPGDILLFGRMRALGAAGDLDIRGAGPGIRDFEVRSPKSQPPSVVG